MRELYDKVDKKDPFKLDPGKVLDVLGQIVAVVPGAGATGATAAIKATKTLYQVHAFIAWASDLIRSGKSLPWAGAAANPGSWGNVIATLGDIDDVQTRMFKDAREQLSAIKRCLLRRWGRTRYLYEEMLQKQLISPELGDYIASRIDTGWNYVMWQQLIWSMYRVRAQGPVTSTFIFPNHYPVDFDNFQSAHNGKPGAKDRLGYVFKGQVADHDLGGRARQKEGVVYAYYLKTRAGTNETDRYEFFKYRLVSNDDTVPFTTDMFDYLRDHYGIERRHFVLATHWDETSKIDKSLFGPAGRYFDPENNLKLDSDHTLTFDSSHRDATWPGWAVDADRHSQTPDRIDFTLIESTKSGQGGEVGGNEFKKVHECYKIRWVEGLGRIDAVFQDAGDSTRHFFGDGSYVRWAGGAEVVYEDKIKLSGQHAKETVERIHVRPMDPGPNGNWPGVWTSGLQAALPFGERQVLFFRRILNLDADRPGPELAVLQYDLQKRRTVGDARRVLDVWPDFPWAHEGIDTAVTLFGKHYFFRGAEVVVYDAIDGVDRTAGNRVHGPAPAEEHFDTSINPQWNWADGCSAAWLEGVMLYVVRNDEYVWFTAPPHQVDDRGLARLKSVSGGNASMRDFDHVLRIPRQ